MLQRYEGNVNVRVKVKVKGDWLRVSVTLWLIFRSRISCVSKIGSSRHAALHALVSLSPELVEWVEGKSAG
jgi:hypothetical protein